MDAKKKVFLVDVSEVWRKVLSNMLSVEPDLEVVGEIGSTQGAMLMLDEIETDIIMLETNRNDKIPVGEAVTQLKAIKPGIHVILCVEKKDIEFVESTFHNVAVDFVTKPYKREFVLRTIRECIGR